MNLIIPGSLEITKGRRWFLVVMLFVAAMINYIDRATIAVSLPEISSDLGLTSTSKGLVLSAFFWSYALMQIPMGWLADRYNLRWLYAGAFGLWSLACGLTGFANSLVTLIGFRLLLGIGEAIYLPGSLKLISKLFAPRDRGFPTGFFDSGTRAGLAVGAPLVGLLTVQYGWRNMFFLVGSFSLLWLPLWVWGFPKRLQESGEKAASRQDPAMRSRGFSLTVNRNLVGACLGFFCLGYYGYLLVTWLPDYLVQVRHLTILEAGLYSALPFAVWAISGPLGGWLADWLIRRGSNETRVRKGIITVGFSTGLLLIPATKVEDVRLAVALVVAASLVGFSTANILVIFQACAPRNEVARWAGAGNFVGNLGGVASPLVTGYLLSYTGSFFAAFALAPVALLAGLFSYWFIVQELKPPDGEQAATGGYPA